jgi:ElaB/YqjD/DUF883 family membrane-anchored ribosome-binding protein
VATKETQQQGQEMSQGVSAKAQDLAAQAKEQAQEKVGEVKGRASDRLHEQIANQSANLAERIGPFPEAFRKAAAYLDSQGSGPAAEAAGRAADRAEQLGSYLEEASPDRMLGDLEAFARRRPWMVGGIGAAAGFVASRFLTASSERRYESRYRTEQWPRIQSPAPAGNGANEITALPGALSESSYGGR